MDSRRIIIFIAGVMLVFVVNQFVWNWFQPPKPLAAKAPVAQKGKDDKDKNAPAKLVIKVVTCTDWNRFRRARHWTE